MPAMPRISPPRAVKDTLSSRLTPSPSRHVTPFSSSRRTGVSYRGRSMFSVTLRPTIMSVRAWGLVWLVRTVPMYLPLRSTATLSDRAITSWSLWVMMTMALPSARMLRSTSKRRSVSWGVRTAVGSSRMRMSAPR